MSELREVLESEHLHFKVFGVRVPARTRDGRDKKIATKARVAKIADMPSSSKRARPSSSKKSDAAKARVISFGRKETLPRKGTASVGRRKPLVEPPLDVPTEPPAPLAGSANRARRQKQTETGAIRTKPTRATGRTSRKPKKADGKEILNVPSLVVPETPVAVVEKGPATGPETSTVIAPAIEQLVAALEPVVEKVGAAESTATANEVSATTTLEPPAVEVLAAAETEMVVEESAILEEATIVEVPIAHPVEAAICPSTDMGQRPVSEENGAPALARTAANSAAPVAPKQWHGKRALMTALSRVLSTLSRWTRVRL